MQGMDHSMMSGKIDESQPHGHDAGGQSMTTTPQPMGSPMMSGGPMTTMMDHSAHTGTTVFHEEADVKNGLSVNMNISPVPYIAGDSLSLSFLVNIKPQNTFVSTSDLQIEHEKLMHVIGVRSDLNEFFHIHPQVAGEGSFAVEHTFNKPGMYKVWSEIKKDDVVHAFGHPQVSVQGTGPKEEKSISFNRNVYVGEYQASLQNGTLTASRDNRLAINISTLNGVGVKTEDYLGASMHLSIIKDDLKQFIHAHPEGHTHTNRGIINEAKADVGHDHSAESLIEFNINFPEPGLYKAFAQFRPEGINLPQDDYLLAEFWLQVEEKRSFAISSWWGLLIFSVIAIGLLSLAVNKYISVRGAE